MRKKILWIIGSIFGTMLLLIISFVSYGYMTMQPTEGDTYDKNIVIVNENFPSDIVIYGEEIKFREELKYRNIDKIDEANMIQDSYEFRFLVINDRLGNVVLTKEDAALILELIMQRRLMGFYYIGTEKLNMLKDSGIIQNELSSSACAFYTGYVHGFLKYDIEWLYKNDELAIRQNDEFLGDVLLSHIVRLIQTNK